MDRSRYDRPPLHTLPWDPSTCDIMVDRVPYFDAEVDDRLWAQPRFQWRQQLWPIGRERMGWGGMTAASITLALHVLDRLLPWTPGQHASYFGRQLPVSPEAVELLHACTARWIAPIPYWGAILRGEELQAWVREELGSSIDLTIP